MKIISLFIRGYKRLLFNGIKEFKITPIEKNQLILGGNGTGKSSVIELLTPLPPEGVFFDETGFKSIEIEHNNHYYILENDFSKGKAGKHSFVKDNEELNPGGTGKIQKELVEEEFKITPAIHRLLLGKEHFTAMPIAKRREWFTQLSDVDYTFALRYYNKAKEKHRDVVGAINRNKKRIATEVAKFITDEEEKKLLQEIQLLEEDLAKLQARRSPITKASIESLNEYNIAITELNSLHQNFRNHFKEYHKTRMDFDVNNTEEITELLNYVRIEIAKIETKQNNEVSQLMKFNEEIQLLKSLGEETLLELQTKCESFKNEIADLLNKQFLQLTFEDPYLVRNTFRSVYDYLESVFTTIPDNSEGFYSREKIRDYTNQLEIKKHQLFEVELNIRNMNIAKTTLQTYFEKGESECPSCHYSWIPGFDKKELERIERELPQQEKEAETLAKLVMETEQALQDQRMYFDQLIAFVKYTEGYQSLGVLWDYLIDKKYVSQNPRMALQILSQFAHDVEIAIQVKELENEILLTQTKMQNYDSNAQEKLIHVLKEKTLIEERISFLTDTLSKERNKENQILRFQRFLNETESYMVSCDGLQNTVDESLAETLETMEKEAILEMIKIIQVELGNKINVVNETTVQKKVVEEIKQQLVELEHEEKLLKLIVKEVSPSEGLIADGLMGFIKSFCLQMNQIIKKIWSYQLEVLPPHFEEGETVDLDYKFPCLIENGENISSDVSEVSAGTADIIDFAYKVVAMSHLGLGHTPVFMDEFGVKLDEFHRNEASRVVNEMMEQNLFSQLFIVSHHESAYGGLKNTDICVLCPDNILLPSGTYNQHVVFK